MKRHSLISIILVLILLISSFSVCAFAAQIGDVSGDGTIASEDARLALRAAVGLENLSEEAFKAADVDYSNDLTSADARLILRAAVGLEELKEQVQHTHDFTETKTESLSTCIKAGEERTYCECGEYITKELPLAEEHIYGSANIIKNATCTETGTAQYTCTDCGKKLDVTLSAQHTFTKIGVTTASKCTVPGCNAELPAFNTIVNDLKDGGNAFNYTSITKSHTVSKISDLTGTLAMFKDMMGEEAEETTAFDNRSDRLVTRTSFYTRNENFVSDLADSDVKSISIEKANDVDFINSLPYYYTNDSTLNDLRDIHYKVFPQIYKVTVVLNEETKDVTKNTAPASKFDKIHSADYNKNLNLLNEQMSEQFASFPEEMSSFIGTPSLSKCLITSNLTVVYYIDATSYVPVAANYVYGMDISTTIQFKQLNIATSSMTMENDSLDNNYFIFEEL